jgi:ATP phosphoribosyltransferase
MLRMAVPNKGMLADDACRLLAEAGYRCRPDAREMVVRDRQNDVEFVFLRPRDIATYVSKGVLDAGITGRDLALDSEASVTEMLPLGFGVSSFCYAAPPQSGITQAGLGGLRIATSFPNLVTKDLTRKGVSAQIICLEGAVEISVQLGVADAIADVVQSGRTLRMAGLEAVGPPILESEAVLISAAKGRPSRAADVLVERLRGITVARDYAMVEYDVPREHLSVVCLHPGYRVTHDMPAEQERLVCRARHGQAA